MDLQTMLVQSSPLKMLVLFTEFTYCMLSRCTFSSIFRTTRRVAKKKQAERIYGRNTSNKELWDCILRVEVD